MEVFMVALKWIYGEVRPKELLPQSKQGSKDELTQFVVDALSIANELLLDELKEIISQVLLYFIDSRNVSAFLEIADTYEAQGLKDCCMEFQLEAQLKHEQSQCLLYIRGEEGFYAQLKSQVDEIMQRRKSERRDLYEKSLNEQKSIKSHPSPKLLPVENSVFEMEMDAEVPEEPAVSPEVVSEEPALTPTKSGKKKRQKGKTQNLAEFQMGPAIPSVQAEALQLVVEDERPFASRPPPKTWSPVPSPSSKVSLATIMSEAKQSSARAVPKTKQLETKQTTSRVGNMGTSPVNIQAKTPEGNKILSTSSPKAWGVVNASPKQENGRAKKNFRELLEEEQMASQAQAEEKAATAQQQQAATAQASTASQWTGYSYTQQPQVVANGTAPTAATYMQQYAHAGYDTQNTYAQQVSQAGYTYPTAQPTATGSAAYSTTGYSAQQPSHQYGTTPSRLLVQIRTPTTRTKLEAGRTEGQSGMGEDTAAPVLTEVPADEEELLGAASVVEVVDTAWALVAAMETMGTAVLPDLRIRMMGTAKTKMRLHILLGTRMLPALPIDIHRTRRQAAVGAVAVETIWIKDTGENRKEVEDTVEIRAAGAMGEAGTTSHPTTEATAVTTTILRNRMGAEEAVVEGEAIAEAEVPIVTMTTITEVVEAVEEGTVAAVVAVVGVDMIAWVHGTCHLRRVMADVEGTTGAGVTINATTISIAITIVMDLKSDCTLAMSKVVKKTVITTTTGPGGKPVTTTTTTVTTAPSAPSQGKPTPYATPATSPKQPLQSVTQTVGSAGSAGNKAPKPPQAASTSAAPIGPVGAAAGKLFFEDHPAWKSIWDNKPMVDPKYAGPCLEFTEEKFAKVDAHARAPVPASVCHDVKALARHLTSPFPDPLDRLRSIFVWITDNIAYDVQSYMSGALPKSSKPEDTLKLRKGVCDQYAELFNALTLEGVPGVLCKKVAGASLGGSSQPGDGFLELKSHAWNVVLIRGEYSEPSQQYLERPISSQDWLRLPWIKTDTYFSNRIILTNVTGNTIEGTGGMLTFLRTDKGKIVIEFETEKDLPISAQLYFPMPDRELPRREVIWLDHYAKRKGLSGKKQAAPGGCCQLYSLYGKGRHGRTKHTLILRFPDAGQGHLILFTSNAAPAPKNAANATTTKLSSSLEFRVENMLPACHLPPITTGPAVFGTAEGIQIVEPWQSVLQVGRDVRFLTTPGRGNACGKVFVCHREELSSKKTFLSETADGYLSAAVKVHRAGEWVVGIAGQGGSIAFAAKFTAK
ncbi:hypothetical protein HDU96_006877 [Phlyctochytrium bullatum]|nr:hypothetical protein HDU96_006877 [Phlyctochytrium bullatum]